MNKHKLKRLENKANNKELIEAPFFTYVENNNLVIKREIVDKLGYNSKDLPTPKDNGAFYSSGDSSLCLLSLEHPLIIIDEAKEYVYLKGAIGKMIIL
jgi:hypothetical protein